MSKIKTILTKETKFENYLLVILSVVAMVLGVLILCNVLTVIDTTPLFGNYPNLFAWIVFGVGALGLLLGLYKIKKDKEDNARKNN
jgi:hypothetical protein